MYFFSSYYLVSWELNGTIGATKSSVLLSVQDPMELNINHIDNPTIFFSMSVAQVHALSIYEAW